MSRKAVLALAGVFLAVALVAPLVISHQTSMIIAVIIEVVLVLLFGVTLYFGLAYPHPEKEE